MPTRFQTFILTSMVITVAVNMYVEMNSTFPHLCIILFQDLNIIACLNSNREKSI